MARSQYEGSPWAGTAWLYALVLLLGLVLIWRFWFTGRPDLGNDPTAAPRAAAPAGPHTSEEQNRIDIFKKAKVSVVNITSAQLRRNGLSLNPQLVPKGSGTGFIWDDKGRIVTNYHVVDGADKVQVTLDDHSTWTAYQIRYDEMHDLAVLWTDIPEGKRTPIQMGESSKLQVGQTVLAIGNPFGLDHSLSNGIVSALGREMKTENGHINRGLIQTDAAINPGNSGGTLLDSSGRLIGVNTAIISPSGAFAGIGFAIPVDVVNRVVPRLISGAKESRPSLGVAVAEDQLARSLGITDGVLIINVTKGGPAEKAGLHPTLRDDDGNIIKGDVIVGIDDHKIGSANEMFAVLADNYKVGQEVAVHIRRDGQPQDVRVTLSAEVR